MRILLLNPPGKELYTRDYYCSKTSKANYCYQPADLLILSGILASAHEVAVIDSLAEELAAEAVFERLDKFQPEVIVFLVGAVSWEEDRSFLRIVKERTGAISMATGDILLEEGEARLKENPALDVIILDFTSSEILAWLEGNREKDFHSLVYFDAKGKFHSSPKRLIGGVIDIPVPRHELFPINRYRYPFVKRVPFATVLTDYGCPYKCSFCVMPHLGYKVRSVENVIAELRSIKNMGINEIYFNDQTFGANVKRANALCEAMITEGFGFGWVCFTRVDLVNADNLALMKQAGCHTLMFGVESGNDATLKRYRKGFNTQQVEETFELCRKMGFDVVATFVLGLPGETEADIRRTIDFSLKIKCDYASYNVIVPRMGTSFRKEVIAAGLVDPTELSMDQTGSYAVMGTEELTAEKIMNLKNEAVKSFYLRPSYLLRRLLKVRSWFDLKNQLNEGWALIKKMGRKSGC